MGMENCVNRDVERVGCEWRTVLIEIRKENGMRMENCVNRDQEREWDANGELC